MCDVHLVDLLTWPACLAVFARTYAQDISICLETIYQYSRTADFAADFTPYMVRSLWSQLYLRTARNVIPGFRPCLVADSARQAREVQAEEGPGRGPGSLLVSVLGLGDVDAPLAVLSAARGGPASPRH